MFTLCPFLAPDFVCLKDKLMEISWNSSSGCILFKMFLKICMSIFFPLILLFFKGNDLQIRTFYTPLQGANTEALLQNMNGVRNTQTSNTISGPAGWTEHETLKARMTGFLRLKIKFTLERLELTCSSDCVTTFTICEFKTVTPRDVWSTPRLAS